MIEALPLHVVLMIGASDNGVGAVLLHTQCTCRLSGGVEKPVAFASRTLMDREKRYSVIDKEAHHLWCHQILPIFVWPTIYSANGP